MNVPRETIEAQALATRPDASAWVSANAGAGKTYVLVERVVRLLLSGERPEGLLCLTFTNAAAAQMAQRVADRLAALALMPDEALDAEIVKLTGRAADEEERRRARRLFAEALETPGGLKIQTIHAFSSALLGRFPLEANISGRFTVLDDAAADELTERAIRAVLQEGAAAPDGKVARAIAALQEHVSDFGLMEAIRTMLAHRRELRAWIARDETFEEAADRLRTALGLAPGETSEAVNREILASPHFPPELVADLCRALAASGTNDQKLCEKLERACAPGGSLEACADAWVSAFFTKELKPAKTFGTKGINARVPALAERVAAEQDRLAVLLDKRTAALAVAATLPLALIAERVLGHIEAEKRRRGLIDYDDQIEHAGRLLGRQDAAAWVQFKLDRGIDHILVDEAQDTSPAQWFIIDRLAEEFFGGAGAREKRRTMFAVGDEKQSIYSFQDAAPALFREKREAYAGRAAGIAQPFHPVTLSHSFRSVPQVLSAVDAVFADPALREAVLADGTLRHAAVRANAPGEVEIWPLFAQDTIEPPDDWRLPIDHEGRRSSPRRLAERIAATVKGWITSGERGADGEPVTAGDVIVLVRRRAGFAALMNRAFKDAGVPVAGADRLVVTDHIAAQDLVSLARALITPSDDLSLAEALKSPLFGLTDDDLFALAHGRRGTLAAALEAKAAVDARFAPAARKLAGWRAKARVLRPFDFFATVLGPDGGRRAILERLGHEAADVLDAVLGLALDHERSAVPTLEGFLARLAVARTELKREVDTDPDAVRVMTVHGAKGLEAPIVFLVDGCSAPVAPSHVPNILALGEKDDPAPPPLVWCPRKEYRPERVEEVAARRRAEQAAEYQRLLYVGMTRARDRLIVCGYRRKRDPDAMCWYESVRRALVPECEAVENTRGEITARRWRVPVPAAPPPPAAAGPPAAPAPEPPAWLRERAPRGAAEPAPLRPSEGLGGPAPAWTDTPATGPDGLEAAMRGTIVHSLLEHLPRVEPAKRTDAGLRLLAAALPDTSEETRAHLLAEALAVIDLPEAAAAFCDSARAEIDVAGRILVGGAVRHASGRIDRLIVTPGEVTIVDFKTDRDPPAGPAAVGETYRGQLAIYRALVAAIFPERAVRTVLVWTAVPRWMEVPAALLPPVRCAPAPRVCSP